MAPNITFLKINNNSVLPLRVFVNRREVFKKFNKKTGYDSNSKIDNIVFEAPVLSNNSIIRLRSPLVSIYLSNKDLKSLCQDLKDDLLLIIYELGNNLIQNKILNKLKIQETHNVTSNTTKKNDKNKISFDEVTKLIHKMNNLEKGDDNSTHINGLTLNSKTIQRLSKYTFLIEFEHYWTVNIIIKDIRKLSKIRNILLLREAANMGVTANNENVNLPKSRVILSEYKDDKIGTSALGEEKETDDKFNNDDNDIDNPDNLLQYTGSMDSMQVSIRTIKHKKTTKILIEDEDSVSEIRNAVVTVDEDTELNREDEKIKLVFGYDPTWNLGHCIDIQVLSRPRRSTVRPSET
ncbi:uncharacterized protein SCODWIG_00544 [Saccharomycodes ludwigii]|uniref:Uncharacterized protein n=1 Tax=Saccharomycodes ludwigii TaxID=36035 RepID=A0A376B294_9ASCO|nr:uncharacterized protein SCODWIG_00544 [Saccharomycodes ludwigii]